MNLEEFKKAVYEQKLPKLKHMSVDCIKCGKTMFEIDSNDDIKGPFILTCDECRSKNDVNRYRL